MQNSAAPKFERIEKIGYRSNLNFECNTERGFKEPLSMALGKNNIKIHICNVSIVAKKKTSASVSAKPKLNVLSAEKRYICAAPLEFRLIWHFD